MKKLMLLLIVGLLAASAQGVCPEPVAIDPNTLPFDFDANSLNIPIIAWRIVEPNKPAALQLNVCDNEGDIAALVAQGAPVGLVTEPADWIEWGKYLDAPSQQVYQIQLAWRKEDEGRCDIYTYAFADKKHVAVAQWYAILFYHEIQPNDAPVPVTPIDIVPF